MTTDDLIPLLEQAGISQEVWFEHHRSIERLVSLVISVERERIEELEKITGDMADAAIEVHEAVLAEREACAKVCEEIGGAEALDCAADIRARGESK